MAKRTVCLCDGKYIGIEYIFTVIDGKQINDPEKLKELRAKSRRKELFCPCGCGSNLILVAGDKNIREQHFRLRDLTFKDLCTEVVEDPISTNSKIVLKCWLDDKLETDDVETRVPISSVGDINRKYEFSFLSRDKKVAISYSHERANLSDEKLGILQVNSEGIQLIYVVDKKNSGCNGQYPEALIKVQDRQGYCLFLDVENSSYSNAKMHAVFYRKDNRELWREIPFASGWLSDFTISEKGLVQYRHENLQAIKSNFFLLEEQRQRVEVRKEIPKRQKDAWSREKKEVTSRTETSELENDFGRNMEKYFVQQYTKIIDDEGNRWIKCKYCELIAKVTEFSSYGGKNEVNLGICKKCASK